MFNIGIFFVQILLFKFKEKVFCDYVYFIKFENLYVLFFDGELGEVEYLLEFKYKIYKLCGFLKSLGWEFDVIYVDILLVFNFYILFVLIVVEGVLILFDCDVFFCKVFYFLLENIQEICEDYNEDLWVQGIVVNQYQLCVCLFKELVVLLVEEGLLIFDSKLFVSVVMCEFYECVILLINWSFKYKFMQEYQVFYKEFSGGWCQFGVILCIGKIWCYVLFLLCLFLGWIIKRNVIRRGYVNFIQGCFGGGVIDNWVGGFDGCECGFELCLVGGFGVLFLVSVYGLLYVFCYGW